MANKYKKWHDAIIERARSRPHNDGYVEKHHIIPRCIGGTDDEDNIVALFHREHFIIHMLLPKLYEGKNKIKMQHALGRFLQKTTNQNRDTTSRQYDICRKAIKDARTGTSLSDETKLKISIANKGKPNPLRGQTGIWNHTTQAKERIRDYQTGRQRSEKTRALMSASKLGHTYGMKGKTHKDDTKEKMSNKRKEYWTKERRETFSQKKKGQIFSETHLKNLTEKNKQNGMMRRGKPKPKTTCPHCGKTGGNSLMTRYHFDNCKQSLSDQ